MDNMMLNWNPKYSDEIYDADFDIMSAKSIDLMFETDNEYVIYTVSNMAKQAGFGDTDKSLVATAASELATNILRYAKKGKIISSIVKKKTTGIMGIELLACDNGPGIADIGLAIQDHFSTSKNSLGSGLTSVRRIMDEFYIESTMGKGTKLLVRKWQTSKILYSKAL